MKSKIIIFLVIFLAFVLRFWHLGENPPSLDWDEASLGYNAYSLLKTGKDEYGNLLPLSIRSFGDYKPPLYTYLTIIPVAVFGLNEFSTRFISAFFGTLTVSIGYWLIKKLFPGKPAIFYFLFIILFAVSPWHIQFSRVAFEANLGLFFILTGIWLFLEALNNSKLFILSSISFALSMYAYHSPRIIVPLLFTSLFIIFRQNIKNKLREVIISLMIAFVIIFPLIYQIRSSVSARFGSVTILNPNERLGDSIKFIEYDQQSKDILGKLMHNRRIIYSKDILTGYLDHFNFDFLFLTGDAPGRHHAVDIGMLYIFDLPFILIGFYYLFINLSKSGCKLILSWFLIAPVASALTTGTPHAVRAIYFLPLYQIFSVLGLFEFMKYIKVRFIKLKSGVLIIISALLIINFYYYLHMYWIHTPAEKAKDWQYGYKQVVENVKEIENNYTNIIVTSRYDQPYIFFLFYKKIDPVWYQNSWEEVKIERFYRKFGKYEFRNINWDEDARKNNTLIIGAEGEIPGNVPGKIKDIYFPDGSLAFRIVGR